MYSLLTHLSINHSAKEYCRNDKQHGKIHTNNIEGFWALLKCGIIGQFHKVSSKYLHCYIDEFCFRYNQRKNEFVFNNPLIQCL